ncbi:MAG TPA: hypothetical protein VFZ37_01515 [Jiangellaceae bacterium]
MLDRWVEDDRPALPLVVAVLTMCAIAGFVFGGVLASLPASGGGSADPSQSPTATEPVMVEVAGVEASCQREPAQDHAGETVEYLPEFVHDGDSQTAWQCRGDGAGETLTFALDEPAPIAELGIVPGYAKVDPTEDTDWYPRYRRLTEVRWHFDEGDPVSHVLDPDPELREPQFMTLDEARTTSTLTMEIVSSELGTDDWRNMAVTEVVIMACDRC